MENVSAVRNRSFDFFWMDHTEKKIEKEKFIFIASRNIYFIVPFIDAFADGVFLSHSRSQRFMGWC